MEKVPFLAVLFLDALGIGVIFRVRRKTKVRRQVAQDIVLERYLLCGNGTPASVTDGYLKIIKEGFIRDPVDVSGERVRVMLAAGKEYDLVRLLVGVQKNGTGKGEVLLLGVIRHLIKKGDLSAVSSVLSTNGNRKLMISVMKSFYKIDYLNGDRVSLEIAADRIVESYRPFVCRRKRERLREVLKCAIAKAA